MHYSSYAEQLYMSLMFLVFLPAQVSMLLMGAVLATTVCVQSLKFSLWESTQPQVSLEWQIDPSVHQPTHPHYDPDASNWPTLTD